MSLSDAILKAVQARGQGAAANEVLSCLAREFGMTVRPNHLGIALQRHRRAADAEGLGFARKCLAIGVHR
jgi:hypothetical protein